jgi:hypothetical protein
VADYILLENGTDRYQLEDASGNILDEASTETTDLVIQDAAHGHAADNIALAQAHPPLVIQDATHAHAADNVALTQVHNLTVADATHAHSADNLYIGPTVHYVEGFEHQTLSGLQFGAGSTGLFDGITVAGSSILPTGGRNGGAALQISPANAVCRVFKLIPGTDPAVAVSSFYIKFTAFPTTDAIVGGVGVQSGAQGRLLYKKSTGKLNVSWGTTPDADVGPVLDLDRWYLVDLRVDVTTNPRKLDCQVDGGTTVHIESATAGSFCDAYVFGNDTGTETYTAQYDDFVASNLGSDFPMGPHHVYQVVPTADGTHNAGTNVIEADDGTDIGTATAFDLLDEVPATAGNYVQQVATGTGNYAEVTFADTTETSIWGIEAWAALFSSGTTANAGTTRIVDANGNTVVDVFAGDMSELSPVHFKNTVVPAPATTGWVTQTLNALKARVGFSGNVASVPRWSAVGLQYAAQGPGPDLVIHKARHGHAADNLTITEDAGPTNLVIQDATHGHAADSPALVQQHTLVIQDAAHGHTADNLALTQVHVLTIADATHANATDGVALTQQHVLSVADALHAQAADNLTITENGAADLVIADATHGHAADSLTLTQAHILVLADATHGHAGDNLALTQVHTLVLQDALHAHTADVVLLSVPGGGPDPNPQPDTVRMRRKLWTTSSHR